MHIYRAFRKNSDHSNSIEYLHLYLPPRVCPRARPHRSSQRTLLVEQATDAVAYLKMRKRKPSALTWAPEDIVLALKVNGAHAYGVPELLLAEVQRKVTVGGNTGADLRMMLENEALLGDFLTLKVGVISEVNFQVV